MEKFNQTTVHCIELLEKEYHPVGQYFRKSTWFDKRKRAVKTLLGRSFTKQEVESILKKRYERKLSREVTKRPHLLQRAAFFKAVKECVFDPNATSSRYNTTGIDWKAFHRPSSNGRGWVIIAPDEPGNNWYIEDPILVKILSKKFLPSA
jgi:hypothetical protein